MWLFNSINFRHTGFGDNGYYDCIFSDVITERLYSVGWEVEQLTICIQGEVGENRRYKWVFRLKKAVDSMALDNLEIKRNLPNFPDKLEYGSAKGNLSSLDECEREINEVLTAVLVYVTN